MRFSINRAFRKQLYNFESLYESTRRTCTVFWTVTMLQNTLTFTWDSYGSMWLLMVMRQTCNQLLAHTLRSISGVWNIWIQNFLRTTLSVSVRCWTMDSLYTFKCKHFRNTRHTVTFVKTFLRHPIFIPIRVQNLMSYKNWFIASVCLFSCFQGHVFLPRNKIYLKIIVMENSMLDSSCSTRGNTWVPSSLSLRSAEFFVAKGKVVSVFN
jgi:hypothetical protein